MRARFALTAILLQLAMRAADTFNTRLAHFPMWALAALQASSLQLAMRASI